MTASGSAARGEPGRLAAPGDYEYDLAHETAAPPPAAGRRAAPECGPPSPSPAAGDPAEDMGYDEAHDF